MATSQRFAVATQVDPDTTTNIGASLSGSWAGDLDSGATINSVTIYVELTGTGWGDDTWGFSTASAEYNGVDQATLAVSGSGFGNETATRGPTADNTPGADSYRIDQLDVNVSYNKVKGPDGGLVTLTANSYVTVDYTAGAASQGITATAIASTASVGSPSLTGGTTYEHAGGTVSFVSPSDSADVGVSTANLTVTYPTVSAGDIGIATTMSSTDDTHSLDDAGYERIVTFAGLAGSNRYTGVWIKTLTGSEVDLTMSVTNAVQHSICLHVFRSSVVADTWNYTLGSGDPQEGENSINPTNNAITTAEDNALLFLHLALSGADCDTVGVPSTPTGLVAGSSVITDSSPWRQQVNAYKVDAGTAGTVTPSAWQNTGEASPTVDWTTVTLAFDPMVEASGAQNISPTAIGSGASVGSPALSPGTVSVSATPINSGNTLGAPSLTPGAVSITATAIASSASVTTPTVDANYDITATAIASTSNVGAPALAAGAVDIAATAIASTSSVGTPSLANTANITATSIASGSSVGTPTLTPGSVDISPTAIASGSSVGSPTPTAGAVDISPTPIASGSSVTTPTVSAGGSDITATPIASTTAVATPAVTPGAVNIAPTGITASSSVTAPTLNAGAVTIAATAIASTATVGSPTVGSSYTITATAVASTATLGAPSLAVDQTITATGIASTVAITAPAVATDGLAAPVAIAPTTTVGSPTVNPGAVTITATAIGSTSSITTPSLTPGAVNLTASAIASTVSVTTPSLTPGAANIAATAIGSTSTVTTPSLATSAAAQISATAIASSSSVTVPALKAGPVFIVPDPIPSLSTLASVLVAIRTYAWPSYLIDRPADLGEPRVLDGVIKEDLSLWSRVDTYRRALTLVKASGTWTSPKRIPVDYDRLVGGGYESEVTAAELDEMVSDGVITTTQRDEVLAG